MIFIAAGLVDSIPLKVYVPETTQEFREGVRLVGSLGPNDGMLFNFNKHERLIFENSGVNQDISILFFDDLSNDQAIVSEICILKANSPQWVTTRYPHAMALEVSVDFCRLNKIQVGSIVSISIESAESRSNYIINREPLDED